MLITRLETLDQAKALVDCFYATYGLAFHRRYVYDPHALLDKNRNGSFVSFIAMEHGRVQGHLAVLQPFYELTDDDGLPISDPATREIGLSVVSPKAHRRGVQASLGLAMHRWARDEGIVGAYMKCVTNHTFSQRSAFAAGGTPVALYLGGVPRWIAYEADPDMSAAPISTVVFYVPVRVQEQRSIALAPSQAWLWEAIRPTRMVRHAAGPSAMPVTEPTRMQVTWQGDRRVAAIHVLHAGRDLAERLDDQVNWLLGGHIEHISAYLPADSPVVAHQAMDLQASGLFLGGWIPALYRGGRDALVYQVMAHQSLDPTLIAVHSDQGKALKERVFQEWRSTHQVRQAA